MGYIFQLNRLNEKLYEVEADEIKNIIESGRRVVLNFPPGGAKAGFLDSNSKYTESDLRNASESGRWETYASLNRLINACKGKGINDTLNNASIFSTSYLDKVTTSKNSFGLMNEYNYDPTVDETTSKFNTTVHQSIVRSFLMKFVTNENGEKLNVKTASDRMKNLTFFSHSIGSTHVCIINNIMCNEMAKAGYSRDETKHIMSNTLLLAIAPVSLLAGKHQPNFKLITIEAKNDAQLNMLRPHAERFKLFNEKDFTILKEAKNKICLLITNQHEKFRYINHARKEKERIDDPAHNIRNYSSYKLGENNIGAVVIDNILRNRIEGKGDDLENLEDLMVRRITPQEDFFSSVRNIYSRVIAEEIQKCRGTQL